MDREHKIIECDVVTIGAGISGLTAAYRLHQQAAHLRIIVLEAKDRIGGRTLTEDLITEPDGTAHPWNLGGQWIGLNQPTAVDLINELGLELYPYTGHEVTGHRLLMDIPSGKIVSSSISSPSISLLQLLQLALLLKEMNLRSELTCLQHPYAYKEAKEMDTISLKGFLNRRNPAKCLYDLMTILSRISFGVESDVMSFLHFLHLVKCATSVEKFMNLDASSAQGYVVRGGAQQIAERLCDHLGMSNVHLNSPVTSIIIEDHGRCKVGTDNGQIFRCKHVISSVPLNMLVKLSISPPLARPKMHCLNHHHRGFVIKSIITYKKDFWTDAGYSGEIMSTNGPITMSFTGTSGYGGHAIVIFCSGNQAIYWSMQCDESRRQATIDELVRYLGVRARDYLCYRELNWYKEPYIGFGPVCSPEPGVQYYRNALSESHHCVHFAGSETADTWMGFIAGAIQAGNRAAEEVLLQDASDGKANERPSASTCNNIHVMSAMQKFRLLCINFGWILINAIRSIFGHEV